MIFGCNSEDASFHLTWIYQCFRWEENKRKKRRSIRLNQMPQDPFWKRFMSYWIQWAGFLLFLILERILGVSIVHFSTEPFPVQGHLIFWCNNLCEWVVKSLISFVLPFVGGEDWRKTSEVVNVLKLFMKLIRIFFRFFLFHLWKMTCLILHPVIIHACVEGIYGENELLLKGGKQNHA